MKVLSFASLVTALISVAGIANADTLVDRCSGISTNNQKVVVLVYRGQNADAAGGDSVVIVSETNKGRRIYTSRTAGSKPSEILTSGNNSGLKLTIHYDAGYLWLGDGHETFALTCVAQ